MTRYALNSALAGLALASLPAPALALEPKCPEEGAECWFELANKPGCHAAWKGNLRQFYRGTSASDRWSWSGGCTGGLASGEGILSSDDGDVFEGAFVEGVLQGQWSLRSQFAVMGVLEGLFVDGIQQGQWTIRSSIGVSEGPYVGGKKHGLWKTRLRDGSVSEVTFVEGKPHGLLIGRTADGSAFGGLFVSGKKHGLWTEHDPIRGYTGTGFYVDGKQDGWWTERSSSGSTKVVEYRDGEPVE